jgi:hypothetical protein
MIKMKMKIKIKNRTEPVHESLNLILNLILCRSHTP